MIGAIALVAFTASAVGLSLAAIQEREAYARADRESAVALDLQRVGQQQALRALASLSFIAQMDADEVTARQLVGEPRQPPWFSPSDADPEAVGRPARSGRRAPARGRPGSSRQSAETLTAESQSGLRRLDRERGPAAERSAGGARLGSRLGALVRARPAGAVQGVRCDVVAVAPGSQDLVGARIDVHRRPGRARAGRPSCSPSRRARSGRHRSARTLLLIGGVGTGLGVAIALLPLPDLMVGTGVPRGDTAQAVRRSAGGERVRLLHGR